MHFKWWQPIAYDDLKMTSQFLDELMILDGHHEVIRGQQRLIPDHGYFWL